MKTYRQHCNSFGSRRVKHIHARNNEWVHVHRSQPVTQSFSGSADSLWPVAIKIGAAILAFVIISKILTAILPFLVLGAIGWFFLITHR